MIFRNSRSQISLWSSKHNKRLHYLSVTRQNWDVKIYKHKNAMEPCKLNFLKKYKSLRIINLELADLCYFDIHMELKLFSSFPHDTGISLVVVFISFSKVLIWGGIGLFEIRTQKPIFFYINHLICMEDHLKSMDLFLHLLWKNHMS